MRFSQCPAERRTAADGSAGIARYGVIVTDPSLLRVEVNGGTATAGQLRYPALVNYGHITVMQVRSGRTRGLQLHLTRLDAANRELFGTGLDDERVRDHI